MSGYHGIKSSSQSASPWSQHCNFHTNLKKVLNFLVAKSGYHQPKSGSPSKFQVAWGYRLPLNHTLHQCWKSLMKLMGCFVSQVLKSVRPNLKYPDQNSVLTLQRLFVMKTNSQTHNKLVVRQIFKDVDQINLSLHWASSFAIASATEWVSCISMGLL